MHNLQVVVISDGLILILDTPQQLSGFGFDTDISEKHKFR